MKYFQLINPWTSPNLDEGYVLFKQEDLFVENLPQMREIRRQGKLCDVTIKVEDHHFSAHRIVLAATIPYFYAMFMNEMREHREKEITMKEIEAQWVYVYGQVRCEVKWAIKQPPINWMIITDS